MDIALQSLLAKDQEIRRDFRDGVIAREEFETSNKEIIDSFKEYMTRSPFPTKAEGEAYKAAIVLTLHSNNQGLFEKAIDMVQHADPASVDKSDLGFLIDRLRIMQGKDQVYGTQYKTSQKDEIEFFPIEHPEGVDQRRESIGLPPLAAYREQAASNR